MEKLSEMGPESEDADISIKDIEEARAYALSLPGTTEDLFAGDWISFRVEGRWFMLMQLDAPQPRVAVKLPPDEGSALREQYDGVRPAYHMNKIHWNDLYLEQLDGALVARCIATSYHLTVEKLPKALRRRYE
jgi:predicted DNA-binding protein (MmcQ/YjbR family)